MRDFLDEMREDLAKPARTYSARNVIIELRRACKARDRAIRNGDYHDVLKACQRYAAALKRAEVV